jgi:DNA-binding response OmpR family regulator
LGTFMNNYKNTLTSEISSKKILVVDDQPTIRELVRVTLEIGNYKVLSAENGEQALDIVRAEQPDIILLDIKMPGSDIDGLEVCRRLKENPATAGIYIIIISASAQKADIIAGKVVGANDYLIKPFSPSTLIDKVENVMRRPLSNLWSDLNRGITVPVTEIEDWPQLNL